MALANLAAKLPDAQAKYVKANSGRRRLKRYELQKELRFSFRQGNSLYFGSGRTRDLANDRIRFEADQILPRNSEIELRISWPVRLQDVCPLELVIRGKILRSDGHGCVVNVNTCEFQTCGNRSFDQDPSEEKACSVFA